MTKELIKIKASELAAGLRILADVQRIVSKPVPGCIPDENDPDVFVTDEQLVLYAFALQMEIGELINEMGWKPWKQHKLPDNNRVADEFADVLAFIGILLVHIEHRTGLSLTDLATQYEKKSNINIQRIAGKVEGYGVK